MKKIPLLGLAVVLSAATLGTAAAPPINDTCATASPISPVGLPYQVVLDTTGANNDIGDPVIPCTSLTPNKSVWYTFTPTVSDTYRIETAGTTPADYSPVISVYTGTCPNLVPVPAACEGGRVRVAMNAGVTYTFLVGGSPVIVDPAIRVFVNGIESCPGGAGPGGGGDCGTIFDAKVGDVIKVQAFNRQTTRAIPAGTYAWTFGLNAQPAAGTGESFLFQYTAAASGGSNVTLTYTSPSNESLSRTITIRVAPASSRVEPESIALPQPWTPLEAASTIVLPSAGGTLKLVFERVPPSYPYAYVIPSVARVAGAGGKQFVSDVTITNAEGAESTFGLQLWTATGTKMYGPFTIPAGGTRDFPDVVKTAFGLEDGYGSLIVQSMLRSISGARTYAPATGGGTNGQFGTSVDVTTSNSAGLVAPGEVGVFQAVREDAAFRTNIGLFNVSSDSCPVDVEVRSGTGTLLGATSTVTVPTQQYVQRRLADLVPGVSVAQATVTITHRAAGCLVGGVAYVIDNGSEDPFAVPMRKRP